MKKEKKSSRSKDADHRHHKASRNRHRKQPVSKEKRLKPHRSRSPSTSKRKDEEHENAKTTQEVIVNEEKMDRSPICKAEVDVVPLENFVDDKERMIQELFEVVREESLRKITPDALKHCTLDELKTMCLEELKRMTKGEIIHILSGNDPLLLDAKRNFEEMKGRAEGNSIAQVGQRNLTSDPKDKVSISLQNCGNSEGLTKIGIRVEDEQESVSSITSNMKSEAESDSLELCATQNEIDSLIQEEILNQTGVRSERKAELSDMEILELELRAKIIRSLLKSQKAEVSDEEEEMVQKENVQIAQKNAL